MFVQKPTSTSERWEGPKLNLEETTTFRGIDRTLYIGELENVLQSFAKSHKGFIVWCDVSSPHSRQINQTLHTFLQEFSRYLSLQSPTEFLHRCRLLKCKFEAELMRRTCEIGANAMKEVMKYSKPFVFESHLQAKMEYECQIKGADHPAFPPVVAGGSRANTIHYIDNNQIVKDNEMVLMDAGKGLVFF